MGKGKENQSINGTDAVIFNTVFLFLALLLLFVSLTPRLDKLNYFNNAEWECIEYEELLECKIEFLYRTVSCESLISNKIRCKSETLADGSVLIYDRDDCEQISKCVKWGLHLD